jgi:hypothetical protein
MKKLEAQAKRIEEKIKTVLADRSVLASYRDHDNSVQAELRLSANWSIRYQVDEIHYPKNLEGTWENPLWVRMRQIAGDIFAAAALKSGNKQATIPINARTKTGPELRARAQLIFRLESSKQFLSDHRSATGKRTLAQVRDKITALQTEQKALLPKLREVNAAYLGGKKSEKQAKVQALAAGRFWECDGQMLKDYFSVPFDARAFVDVSERWRVALFAETNSENCSNEKGKYWHKSVPTGRGYLCGIDDNGDEWGFEVPAAFHDTVETAMANVFGVDAKKIKSCYRQGEILFCPATPITEKTNVCHECGAKWVPEPIPGMQDDDGGPLYRCGSCHDNYARPRFVEPPVFAAQEKWQIVESHEAWSPGLEANSRWMRSPREIVVTHPTHETLVLPAGSYRVYVHKTAQD